MTAITLVTSKKFWVVLYDTDTNTYNSFKKASKRAVELSWENAGESYYVMESIEEVRGEVNIVKFPCEEG